MRYYRHGVLCSPVSKESGLENSFWSLSTEWFVWVDLVEKVRYHHSPFLVVVICRTSPSLPRELDKAHCLSCACPRPTRSACCLCSIRHLVRQLVVTPRCMSSFHSSCRYVRPVCLCIAIAMPNMAFSLSLFLVNCGSSTAWQGYTKHPVHLHVRTGPDPDWAGPCWLRKDWSQIGRPMFYLHQPQCCSHAECWFGTPTTARILKTVSFVQRVGAPVSTRREIPVQSFRKFRLIVRTWVEGRGSREKET